MGEEDETPPVLDAPVNAYNVDKGLTLLDAWAMFGEALFGDAIGDAESQRATGEVHPHGLFTHLQLTTDPSNEHKMALAGVGWEEGDDMAPSWTRILPTADLLANF